MLIDLVDRHGHAAGNIFVSKEVSEAARKVASWMRENNVREFYGLTVLDIVDRARYEKPVS